MSLKKTVSTALKSKGKKVKSKGKSEKTSAKGGNKKAKASANRLSSQNQASPAGSKKPQSSKSQPKRSQVKSQPKPQHKNKPKAQTKGLAKTQAQPVQAQPVQAAEAKAKAKKSLSSSDKPLKVGLKKVVATTANKEKTVQDKSSDKAIPKKPKKLSEKKLSAQRKQLQENEKKWEAFYKKAKGIKPLPFAVSREFPAKTPINHSLFGWGWVISNKNDRLEVIFKDKERKLLSNRLEGKKSSW